MQSLDGFVQFQFEENEPLVILRPSKHLGSVKEPLVAKDWRDFMSVLNDSTHYGGDPLDLQRAMCNEWALTGGE